MSQTKEADILPRIRRLDKLVVNRIAAGEVIIRPANALKELIENSLDAKAKSIHILVKQGGLKLLQITDSGVGIMRDDLAIVCERFTTSKLRSFEDLSSISTYGFRGEALASISHVAHLTITTKTRDSPCAYRAKYLDGKLVPLKSNTSSDPKPCAGNNGTQITIEDLFYNVESRRKALNKPNEEYKKIADIVTRYAIHNAGVSFTLEKHGGGPSDISTMQTASTLDNITLVYGISLARELLDIKVASENLGYEACGFISNANYSVKKQIILLFINDRAVDCTGVKKMLDTIYGPLLPRGSSPFVYLSLKLIPSNVDVNVHPTKKEVHFLNEDEILGELGDAINKRLSGTTSSRSFKIQSLLPNAPDSRSTNIKKLAATSSLVKIPVHKMVRNDSSIQSLDSFLSINGKRDEKSQGSLSMEEKKMSGDSYEQTPVIDNKRKGTKRIRTDLELTSIQELRSEVEKKNHEGLATIFKKHVFVGHIEGGRLGLLQSETKLYLVNYKELSCQYFYQIFLEGFSNFGLIQLDPPLSLDNVLSLVLEEKSLQPDWAEDMTVEELAESLVNLLQSKRELLMEYFSIEITDDGKLKSLPLVLQNYQPNIVKLPLFIFEIATKIDWNEEKSCLDSLLHACADFYALEPPLCEANSDEQQEYEKSIVNVVLPDLRNGYYPSVELIHGGYVTEVADLTQLYRVFERC